VDGVSNTVHPDGIRNTVHPRLRAHRPRVRRPPASSTTSSAAVRLKSAGRSCCCGRRTPPKFCTSPQRGGAAAAPPRRGHAPRAVCLVHRGCSPPSFRGRRLLLFNRAGVHAKVAYRVVVAAAPCAEGGRAPCRARAVGGGRWPASPAATTGPAFSAALESRPIPVCLPLRSNGPGEGAKGLRSSPSTTPGVRRQLPLLPIWPRSGNTGTRSLLGLARVCPVLSLAADDAGGRAAGKPTILRAEICDTV